MRGGVVLALAISTSVRAAPTRLWQYVDGVDEAVGYAVAADGAGNVYVAGTRSRTGGTSAALLRRHDAGRAGLIRWTLTRGGTPAVGIEQAAKAVALLPVSGTVYDLIVGGVLWSGTPTGADGWLARLTSGGATVWELSFNGLQSSTDSVEGVAVSPAGEIFAVGRQQVTPGNSDAWLAKVTAAGALVCQTTVPDPFGNPDAALAVAVAGTVYEPVVGGYLSVPGQGLDGWIARYPNSLCSGSWLWYRLFTGPGAAADLVGGVAADPAGNIAVAGALTVAGSLQDILVCRLAPDGAILWSVTVDGGETDFDGALAAAVDASGSLYVAGFVDRLPGNSFQDIWIADFGPGGATLWTVDVVGSGGDDDIGRGIAVAPNGRIYVTGEITDASAGRSLWLAEYGAPGGTPPPAAPTGAYASPTPWRPGSGGVFDAAGITFRNVAPGSTVRIYTLAGSLVAERADVAGTGLISWDGKSDGGADPAAGVYWFVVSPPSGKPDRGKVVIIR